MMATACSAPPTSGFGRSLQPSTGNHNNSIGFLRLALASLVLYSHAYFLGGFGADDLTRWTNHAIEAGSLAVQCFFVLSGALITQSWRQGPSLGRFLWHRFLRIAPAFWVCLAVTAFGFSVILHLHTPEPRDAFLTLQPPAWGYVWRNLFQPRAQIAVGPYPSGSPWGVDWNGSLWTLFYEGTCYLFVAVFGVLGLLTRFRGFGRIALLGFVLLCSVWQLSLRMPTPFLPSVVGRLFDTPGKYLIVLFVAGSAWALFPQFADALRRYAWLGPIACVVTVAGWFLGIHALLTPWSLPPAIFWIAHVLHLANFEKWVDGDYSYGLYVYGYPTQQLLAHFRVHEAGYLIFLAASFLLSGFCAVASWHLVERPALRCKRLWLSPTPTS